MQAERGIRAELDSSIGERAHDVPVDELLRRGHRALARRRLIAGTAALAVAAIVGATAVAVGGSGTHASPAPGYAARPSASPTTPTSAPAPALRTPSRREAARAFRRPLAKFDDRGRLVVVPQAHVVRRVADPFAGSRPGKSVALVLDYRDVRYWFLLYLAPDHSHRDSSYTWSGDYHGSFDAWLRDQTSQVTGSPSSDGSQQDWPGVPGLDLVSFVGGTERLEPVAGVTVLRQQAHVSVGDSFGGPNDQTAAAQVEAADGRRYYVLARRIPGSAPQYIAVSEADGGSTLGDFLDLARAHYADNGGGLL